MVKYKLYIIAIVLYWYPLVTIAQHYLGPMVEVSYNDYIGLPSARKMGYSVGMGVSYVFKENKLLFQTGIDLCRNIHDAQNRDYASIVPNMIDQDGQQCEYHYSIVNKKDKLRSTRVAIPVAIGAMFNNTYFLFGIKPIFTISSNYQISADFAASGWYNNLIEPLEKMDEHVFYTNLPVQKRGHLSSHADLMTTFEVGYEIRNSHGYQLQSSKTPIVRVGAFFEFCAVSFTGDDTSRPTVSLDNASNKLVDFVPQNISLFPLMGSIDVDMRAVREFAVGIRIQALFALRDRNSCNCNR